MALVKLADVIKICLGAFLGALSYYLLFTTKCQPLPCRNSEGLLVDEIIANPLAARNRHEVNRWMYFTERYIFEPSSVGHLEDRIIHRKMELSGLHKQDIEQVLHRAIVLLNAEENSKLELAKLVNGYRRFDPQRGIDYILDVNLVDKEKSIQYSRRLTIVKALKEAQLIPINESLEPATINIILPLINANHSRFVKFMETFERYCLKAKHDVTLLIVADANSDIVAATKLVNVYKKHYPLSAIQIVRLQPKVSSRNSRYWQALDYGTTLLDTYALLLFYDLNVDFKEDFLTRCRHNTYPHKYVYFPMVYALHDSKILMPPSFNQQLDTIRTLNNRDRGFWLHNLYSIVCLFRHDYKLMFNKNLHTMALDRSGSSFFELVLKSGISVFRSADPSLVIAKS